MTFDELLERVATEPDRTSEREVRVPTAERLQLGAATPMRLDVLMADPRHTTERRTFRRGHHLAAVAAVAAHLDTHRDVTPKIDELAALVRQAGASGAPARWRRSRHVRCINATETRRSAMRSHAGVAKPEHEVASESRVTTRGTAIVRGMLLGGGVLSVLLGLLVWPGNVQVLAGPHVVAGFVVIIALWATAWIARRTAGRGTVAMLVGLGGATWLLGYAQHVVQLGAWSWVMVLPHAITGGAGVVWAVGVLARTSHEAAPAAEATQTIKEAAKEFLASKRVAVTGVSRNPTSHGSNVVYRRLRERGYQVFAINPNAGQVEGDRSYPDLTSIPGGVEAVVIATRPDRVMATVRECADLGIRQVWMHRAVGTGSVSEEAAAWARQRGLRVIAGGCPLMFDPAADSGHKVMRSVLTLTGKVPRRV